MNHKKNSIRLFPEYELIISTKTLFMIHHIKKIVLLLKN